MKRLWIGLFLFIVVISGCVFSVFTTNNICGKLEQDVQKIQNEFNCNDAALIIQKIENLESDCEKYINILSLYTPHDRLEPLRETIFELRNSVKKHDKDEFDNAAKYFLSIVNNIKYTEIPTLKNIL